MAHLRKREGLFQADISEELDASGQAVTKWGTGLYRLSKENLQSLSKLYNVLREYLLNEGEDELPTLARRLQLRRVGQSGRYRKESGGFGC